MDICSVTTHDDGSEHIDYFVKTASSHFRVKDVESFKKALSPWPIISVRLTGGDDDDEVFLEVTTDDDDTIDLVWPGSVKGKPGLFNHDFLRTIQAHLRPLQTCGLIEMTYTPDYGDNVAMANVSAEKGFRETCLEDIMEGLGNPKFPFNRITYPGDVNHTADNDPQYSIE